MKTTLEALSEKNLEIGIQLQAEIFRMEPYKNDLINSLTGEIADYFSLQKHWLIKANGKYVGITGLYAYKEYPDDAWLAWFGVIESERRKGYASDVLKKMFDMAREKGFKSFRLYTDEIENSTAVKFYEHMGMTSEVYNNPKDKFRQVGDMLVFSISLNSKPVEKWNNKYMYLGEHDKRNNK